MASSYSSESCGSLDENGKVFVLQNIPENFNKDLIIDYIEGTLDIDVKEVQLHPLVPGRALIYLKQQLEDFSEAERKIRKSCLKSKNVRLLITSRKPAIVVNDLDIQKLSEEFLCLYFECEFAGGREVIEYSKSWPEHNMAIVHFHPQDLEVVENILKRSDLVPLPSEDYHITIQPFYQNFHKYIEQPLIQNEGLTSTAKEKENFIPDDNGDEVLKEEEEVAITKKDNDRGKESEEEENETDEEESEEEEMEEEKENEEEMSEEEETSEEEEDMEDVEVNERDENLKEKKKLHSFDGDETDNSDETDNTSDENNTKEENSSKTITLIKQGSAKEKGKDVIFSSGKRSLTVRGGFRGKGRGNVMGSLMEPSRRGSSSKEGEKNYGSKNKMSSHYGKQQMANEGDDLLIRHEKQHLGRDNKRGGKIAKCDLKHNSRSSSCGSSRNERLISDNYIERGAKQSSYRGRGGTAFVPGGARSIHSPALVNDRCNMSENHHGSHFPESFSTNIHIPNFFGNKEHNTSLESPENDCQVSKILHLRVSEDINSAGQSLHEKDLAFQKAQLENKERHERELAAKETQIKQLEEELANQKEQLKPYSERVQMTAWQKEFLSDCFGSFQGCRVQFDQHENVAILDGKFDSVKHHHMKLLKELNKLKEELFDLTPAMFCILSREQGKQYLHMLNSSQLKGAKIFLQDESLFVVAKDDDSLNYAMDFLKNKINYKEIIKPNAKILTEKLISEQTLLENKFLVKISWSDKDTDISVEGIKDDVFESKRSIAAVIEEYGFNEKSFEVTGVYAKFFNKHLEFQIRNCLQDTKIVDFTFTEAQVFIQFIGDRRAVNLIHRKLTELKTKVTIKTWDLKSEFRHPEDLKLITRGFECEKLKKKIDGFETANKCIITTQLPRLSLTVGASKKGQSARSVHVSKDRKHSKAAAPVHAETKLKFIVKNTCHLVVKPYGDITKERSDVLVCVVDQNADLRKTRVGQIFNKTCPTLWKILHSERDAHPSDPVLTTKGPFNHLKCQAICHIIFTPWDPNTSPALLSTSIQSVINQAVALGAKSVSFPVLGCGRAFGFPPSNVAQITLSSLKLSDFGNTIHKVVLLTPDTELFKEFKKEASNHFQSEPDTVQNKNAGASPGKTVNDDGDDDDDNQSDDTDESEDDELNLEIVQHDDVEKSANAEVSIVAMHDTGLQTLWSNLKKEIEKVCLYTYYFNQEIADFWPKISGNRILQEAQNHCVWVKLSPNPKTKKPGYIIKGMKKDVEAVIKTIDEEFKDFSSHLPKQRIKSDKAPKRGTVDFLRHAANSDELIPSYWKLNTKTYSKNIFKKFTDKIKSSLSEKRSFLVDVDTKTKDAIKRLVAKTWDGSMVGVGFDAQGLSHKNIKVTDVKRIENMELFELYKMQRQLLFRKMCEASNVCPDIGKLKGSKGRIVTTEHLEDFMKEELYYEINEHYLFHGTKNPDAICSNGIDPRVSSEGGMFGKGIYTAEKFTKSDQYTDSIRDRNGPGKQLAIILARVLLGNVFLCNDQHKSVANKQSIKLTRPPCMICLEDKCNCKTQKLFDSVMGDGKWIFREFVVYDKNQCYPEYLIYYQRV